MKAIPTVQHYVRIHLPAVSILLAVSLALVTGASPTDSSADVAASLRADVKALTSPECAGRRVGTPGGEVAMHYLEGQLRDAGVMPAFGERGGYRQGFAVTRGIRVAGTPRVELSGEGLENGRDYEVASFSGSGTVEMVRVVFAGYGISAPELGWDDYAQANVADAAVAVLTGEPPQLSGAVAADDSPTRYGDLRRKAAFARDHGAVAFLALNNPLAAGEDQLPPLEPTYSAANFDLPAIYLKRELLQNSIIHTSGLSWHELVETIHLEGRPHTTTITGVRLSIDLEVEKEIATGFNLIGLIEGADPELSKQFVIIGAHYDHLGEGGPESAAGISSGVIHPGADDNASGVAAAVQIARWAAAQRASLGRSVMVCLFSGEEVGMLGSLAFIRSTPVATGDIYCMLNLDMVGRLREDQLYVACLDSAAEFAPLVSGAAANHQLTVVPGSGAASLGGDHLAFIQNSIPALFLFTGPHADYHRPSDTADKLNYGGLVQVVGFGEQLVHELSTLDPPLTFVAPEGMPIGEVKRVPRSVTMGTIPSFEAHEEPGYVVGGLVPGGAGEQAGLIAGDRIVKILDRRIANIYDFMYVLADLDPGDTVPVQLIRAGEELTFEVVLAARQEQP